MNWIMIKSNSTLLKHEIFILLLFLLGSITAHAQFIDSTHYHIAASSTGTFNQL